MDDAADGNGTVMPDHQYITWLAGDISQDQARIPGWRLDPQIKAGRNCPHCRLKRAPRQRVRGSALLSASEIEHYVRMRKVSQPPAAVTGQPERPGTNR